MPAKGRMRFVRPKNRFSGRANFFGKNGVYSGMNHSIVLTAKGLWKSFGQGEAKVDVIRGLDFSMEQGSFEAVMGASGSGKSTFLHLLASLIAPDKGTIEIEGKPFDRMGDREATLFRRRRIGLVFQDFNLIPTLTAEENIELPQLLDRAKPNRDRVRELAERLGIGHRLKHLPMQLSGGERQRVAVARALFGKPAVLLADEPTGNLDAGSARSLCAVLKKLNAESGCSILMVTHDPVVASSARRIHLLRDGVFTDCFEPEGDATRVFDRYFRDKLA